MKKLTFMLIATLFAVVGFAQKPLARAEVFAKTTNEVVQNAGIKKAPHQLTHKMMSSTSTRARAQKKAATAADFVGDYTWDYETSSEISTDLESLTTSTGSAHVTISESTTTEGGITISGMFSNDLEATVKSSDNYDYFVISRGQAAGTSSYGDYIINGLFYYEGDDTNEAGWYYGDIYGYIMDNGTIYIDEWIARILSGGQYNGYTLTPYYVGGSTLTPADPLKVVELPEGVEVKEYVMTYDDGSSPVNVAVDGNDVYFQGMSSYCSEAWVKGTKDEDNKVTFAAMQYMGEYGSYGSSFFFYNGETVFTYDPDADTYSAEGQVFGVLADRYYDGNYTNPVIAPVVEKAAMPANPKVTGMENSNYGWIVEFDVPITDVNGEPMVASKLSYMIYSDTEGVIAPLTFTSATHTKLTEDMTEIPYGFTENYDFYATYIYLNELYSEDWNRIGIQSIYRGGGEENVTEIQWFYIKDYKVMDYTFDFNAMDVPTSTNATTDGDITETLERTEGSVTLAISPKEEGKSTANRFWATAAGPQLRVYSGTLTFSVPAGKGISKIAFNHNGKWGANTVNGEAIANDADAKVATWTLAEGEEPVSQVVVAIAANTQLNSIVVSVETGEIKPVEAPDGLVIEHYYFEGYDTYYEKDITKNVHVGFYGENTVYIQGLSDYVTDAWVKGTLNGTTLTIPETYLGVYESMFGEYDLTFPATTFVYDAETGTFTCAEGFKTLSSDGYAWDEVANVVLTKLNDVAAIPADPEITQITTINTNYPKVNFNIPIVDVDGNPLITDKLTYQLWVEKNGEATPLVLDADLYDYLDEDMSEIPYEFSDDYDIYNEVLYLNQDLDEIYSWDKIGIQSIYYGGGEVNKSNIAWTYNVVPVTVGEALYATYVAPADVDFTTVEGVEAFAATISPKKTYVQLTPVTTVPAGTAVVVKAEKAATFAITKTEGAVLGAENDLVAAVDDVTADGTQYILAQKEEGVGFYKAVGTIAAGKGYLAVGGAGVKGFYGFDDDDATGIDGIGNGQLTIGNEIYNVAGQRVSKMQKGVNIVNGKKILK